MQPLRIAQLSDFHLTSITWNPLRLFSKRFLGNLNWIFRRKGSFAEEPLDALPPLLKTLEPDWILLGGDFTTTSMPEEYAKARAFVEQLSAPWIAIPGNHDHYTYSAHFQKRFYQSFTNPQREPIQDKTDFFRLADHGVEAHRLNDHWWVVALDTAQASNLYSSRGLFSERQESLLEELLSLIPPDASILLFNHYPFFNNDDPRHSLDRGEALEALVRREKRIKAYLHGHSHRHTIADLQASGYPLILDSGAAAHRIEGSWNLLTLEDTHISIDTYRWRNGWKLSEQNQIQWNRS